ncbi:hypothetical protein KOR42_01610 [Thalassoglobus neptunius]|uniref:DUF1570 domain-containing protein n=1 Tax=Thalassoglobus neptunius TaxID=1938619 RepID=A0A5C5X1G8_9PLAN|nr:hypothetical protein KOR42_01610 [Thalassoglobus neptunius]
MNRTETRRQVPLLIGLLSLGVFASFPGLRGYAETRLVESRNFQIYTDLSEEKAEELADRLEKMIVLVSGYWGRPNRKPIRMFVIDDFSNWSSEEISRMPPEGVQFVRNGGGVTMTRYKAIVGGPKVDAETIVYATAARQNPQHEAVHAYCGGTFGSTGPVWYSEGMAEVGKYWREGEKGVNASDYVIDYLTSHPPKPLRDLVDNPLEQTGDSWQNYSWRWALCHLLGFNENYSPKFRPLGLALLAERNVSFAKVYGPQIPEIDFEYRQFLKDLTTNYRCDLCSWDWKTKFRPLSSRSRPTTKVRAGRGWQATGVAVKKDQTYSFVAKGEWSLSSDGPILGAGGDQTGSGVLVGAIFSDYELSEEFEIGAVSTWTAPSDGDLFVRCRDDWGSLDDNDGFVELRVQLDSGSEND